MGWQDRDYHRKRPDDADDRYEPDEDAEYEPEADDDSDQDDPDAPGDTDVDDGDEPDFVACPNCGKMIPEEAEQCPKCGHYVLDEEVSGGKPLIWIIVVVLLVVAMLWVSW